MQRHHRDPIYTVDGHIQHLVGQGTTDGAIHGHGMETAVHYDRHDGSNKKKIRLGQGNAKEGRQGVDAAGRDQRVVTGASQAQPTRRPVLALASGPHPLAPYRTETGTPQLG